MIDAIDAVRRPYDERSRPAAEARVRGKLAGNAEFTALAADAQQQRLQAGLKADLLASWRAEVAKDPRLQQLGELQRAAQWRLDFVAAENSMGFHAAQEEARILAESIDLSRQAQLAAVELKDSLGGAPK